MSGRERSGDAGALRRAAAPDPLDGYRRRLGRRRTRLMGRRAEVLQSWLKDRDDAWLHARRSELGAPLENLDVPGAVATLTIERDRRAAERRRRTASRSALRLRVRADALKRKREARDRRGLLEAAQVQHGLVEQEYANIAELFAAEGRLRRSGRHLDGWMHEYGELAARLVAVERELVARREVAIAEEVERSVLDPPTRIRELIGAAPARSAPERPEWEAITRNLEHERIAREAHGRYGLELKPRSSRDSRHLEARIERLRAQRGMGPLARERGIEASAQENFLH